LDETLGRLEAAFLLSSQAEPILKTIKAASRAGMPQQRPDHLIAAALEAGVISKEQAELIRQAECDRHDAVQVDAFTVEEYQQSRVSGIGIALQKLAQRQDLVG
jgi:acyl-CoA dehydrogenase